MLSRLKRWLTTLASYLEIAISIIIFIAVVACAIQLLIEVGLFDGTILATMQFNVFLARALELVIGAEFIKMLIKHTPGAAIEVLLYAIARQLIVEHTSTWETLIGIVAIAAVFAIRKFLYINSFDEKKRHTLSASRSIKYVNHRYMLHLPGDPESTLGELVYKTLEAQEEKVQEDSMVFFPDAILHVSAMQDGNIREVDVVPLGKKKDM